MAYNAYAGIGGTDTPADICDLFRVTARYLAEKGWTLRSGGAPGADKAFEEGCNAGKGSKEIFLPWKGFEENPSLLYNIPTRAFVLAERFHPKWENVKTQGAQKLLARDCQQILGARLDDPVEAVICWTPGGTGSGGTGQALRIARHYKIPVLDVGNCQSFEEVDEAIGRFIQEEFLAPI